MKKRVISIALALVLVGLLCSIGISGSAAQAGDDGTINWDFIQPVTHLTTPPAGYTAIRTAAQLDNVRNNLSGNYILMNDINLADWGNWTPIGGASLVDWFDGVFDGNGYVVKNMTVNFEAIQDRDEYTSTLNAGLFGNSWGEIKNLGLIASFVCLYDAGYAGGIAGRATKISNCYNTGNVTASAEYSMRIGGIAGSTNLIEYCYHKGDISVLNTNTKDDASSLAFNSDAIAGGIAGCAGYSNRCYNTGNVTAESRLGGAIAGGIFGEGITSESNLLASDCLNIGNVTATALNYAPSGGIAGSSGNYNYNATLQNCINIGKIEATHLDPYYGVYPYPGNSEPEEGYLGGIAGILSSFHFAKNCYYLDSSVKNAVGLNGSIAGENIVNVLALSDSQMSQQASFVGFDFDTVWEMSVNSGYPVLKGMQATEPDKPTVIPVTSMALETTEITLTMGTCETLYANILPANATERRIDWYSNHEDVATVDDGVVIAQSPGVAMICATTYDGGYRDFCIVTVENRDDIFSFANTKEDFGKTSSSKYYISKTDFDKLLSKLDFWDSYFHLNAFVNLTWNTEDLFKKMLNKKWSGSCYGMSLAVALNMQNKIAFNEHFGTKTMSDISAPKNDASKSIESMINYYHLIQYLPSAGIIRYGEFEDIIGGGIGLPFYTIEDGLKRLVNTIKAGNLAIFKYLPTEHTVLIIGYDEDTRRLITYDCTYPNENSYIQVSANFSSCSAVSGPETSGKVTQFLYVSDFDSYDKILYETKNSSRTTSMPVAQENEAKNAAYISFSSNSNTTITNGDGKTLIYDKQTGAINGTMEVYSVSFATNQTADGLNASATMLLLVEDSDYFGYEMKEGDTADIFVTTNKLFASVNSENLYEVIIEKDKGITLKSTGNFDYEASLGVENQYYKMASIKGKAKNTASLAFHGNNVLATGNFSEGTTLTVFSDAYYVNEYDYGTKDFTFSTAHDKVLITDDGSKVEGNIDIRVSSKDNGVYDTSLLHSTQPTKPAIIGPTTVDYKGTTTLIADQPVNFTTDSQYVTLERINDTTVKVTSTKNFIKNGSAVIKATPIDGDIYDDEATTITVKVKPTFMQWMQIIFLFGWIWM